MKSLTIVRSNRCRSRLPRVAAAVTLCLGLGTWAAPARAQYGSSFYYYNPRTGFGYSQGWSLGGNSYAGGFSFTTPRRSYSTYGGYGPNRYFNGMSYANRRYAYSQGWALGRNYYRGGTAYMRSPYYYRPYYRPYYGYGGGY